jgi:DUF1009 family protein
MHQGDEGTALGVIAGAGGLPVEAARLLRGQGYSISAIGFQDLTDRTLEKEVSELRWLRLGQLVAMAEALHDMGVQRLVLVGKVPKSLLFLGEGVAEPDAEAIHLLSEERDRGDEPLMQAIARWIEEQGFLLSDQGEMLAPMLAPVGLMSARSPSEMELADFEIGLPVVAQLGRIGIGQCVVVKHGSILAVEAIEGTDAVIRRAGELGGTGATVIKASRPGQDRRFDLPAVGVGTIAAIGESGASGLAIEAGSTLVLDREKMIEAADRANIAVWGFAANRGRP